MKMPTFLISQKLIYQYQVNVLRLHNNPVAMLMVT